MLVNIITEQMEEFLITPNSQVLNTKPLITPQPSFLHLIYTYSSRYLPMPDKQKLEPTQEPITINEPLYNEAKDRIQSEYDLLNQYLNELEKKFFQVNRSQLDCLSDRHRYFLRKFKKYLNEHKKYSEIYNNLDKIVVESQPVQEEINSINFIKMISAQTDSKLQALKNSVQKADEEKCKNHKHIQDLKEKLNKLKSDYFAKKRQELRIQNQIQRKEQTIKDNQVDETMKKIRLQKRHKQSFQTKKYLLLKAQTQYSAERFMNPAPKSFTRSNDSYMEQTLAEIKNINSMNKKYIKKLSQTCEDFKTRKLEDKKRINSKIISQTDLENFRKKSRYGGNLRKSQEEDLLKNEQIIKQLTLTNRLRDEFHKKKPEELLNLLIKTKRLKDLLGIIEEVKNEEMKRGVLEKRKVNLARSQAYKSNANVVVKTFEDYAENSVISMLR